MKQNLLERKIEKIKSNLERSKIIDDCCEIAKKYGNHEKIYSTDLYIYSHKRLVITYREDKDIAGVESGDNLIVRYLTLEEVLQCDRDDIKYENKPMVNSEFGRFKVLIYLPKGGKWERLVKKIKKKKIPSGKVELKKERIDPIKEFKESFGR